MYQRALDMGLFPSARKLAQTVGVTNSTVSTALLLASLPDEVVQAFPGPQSLQFRWAVDLSRAVEENREQIVSRALEIVERGDASRTPKAVLAQLLADEAPAQNGADLQRLKSGGKTVGTVTRDARGGLTIKVKHGVLERSSEAKLLKFVEGLFKP